MRGGGEDDTKFEFTGRKTAMILSFLLIRNIGLKGGVVERYTFYLKIVVAYFHNLQISRLISNPL